MCIKNSYLVISSLALSFQLHSATLTSVNTTESSVDTVAELVFITDNSGSMIDGAEAVSNVMTDLVKTLTCPASTVYLRSEFLVMNWNNSPSVDDPFKATNFDKSIIERLPHITLPQELPAFTLPNGTTVPLTPAFNSESFHQAAHLIAENYPYTPPKNGQNYVKGVVVITDGGMPNTVYYQYDSILMANSALFDNDVVLFGLADANGQTGLEDALKTMIGLQQQIYGTLPPPWKSYQDTGGDYFEYDTTALNTTQLEQSLEDIVCHAVSKAKPTPVAPTASGGTSSIPSSSVLTLLSLFGLISILVVRRIRR